MTGSHVIQKLFKLINFKVLLLQNFHYSRTLNAMQASCKLRAEIVKRFIILTEVDDKTILVGMEIMIGTEKKTKERYFITLATSK